MKTSDLFKSTRFLFTPPTFADEKKNQQAFILFILVWSIIWLSVLYLIASLILSPQTAGDDSIISATGILVNLFLLVLLARGYVRPAAILQVASFWLMFTGIALSIDGLSGPGYMMGYMLVILIAGILLEGRGALVVTILSLIAGLAIYYIQINDLLPLKENIPLIGYWVTSVFMFSLCAVLQYLGARTMRRALLRASESEERFRRLSDAAFEGIMIHKSGCILDTNQKFAEMFGYENPQELISKNGFSFLLAPESSAKIRSQSKEKTDSILDVTGIKKDGSTFPGETQSREMTYRGESARVVTMRDITDRKQAEDQLKQEQEFTTAVLDSVPGLLCLFDGAGQIIRWNKLSEKITGYSPEEVAGMQVFNFLSSEVEPSSVTHTIQEAFQKGRGELEASVMTKSGKSIPFYFTGVSQAIGGKPYLTVIGIDITEQKASEAELRRVNRALRTISKCNETLVRSINEEELLQGICKNIVEVGEYQLACINLVGIDRQGSQSSDYGYCFNWGHDLPTYPGKVNAEMIAASGMVQIATSARQPFFVNQLGHYAHNEQIIQLLQADGFKSMAMVPLSHDDVVFGLLSIYSIQENAFDEDEQRLIIEMASDLAYGLLTQRVRADRKTFLDRLEMSNQELEHSYNATLEGWSYALELRERETAGHSQRVVEMTLELARSLGVPDTQRVHLQRGALLHDIGKMGIPDSILLKPGPLTEDEWRTMRHHPVYAYRLLKSIPYLTHALDIPLNHHERWDGSGYPNQLDGERIPLAARIFAVVDVWDALTSDRPYRLAWTTEEALRYIRDQAGKQFDPGVVAKFMEIMRNTPAG